MNTYYDSSDQLREVDFYIAQLRTQEDRSCVIMIAARIESLLERAINKRLIDPRSGPPQGHRPESRQHH